MTAARIGGRLSPAMGSAEFAVRCRRSSWRPPSCSSTAGRSRGVDEAGRGPLAGPVVAAAVILDPDRIPDGINDSKVLDEETREVLYARIKATAIVGVGIADVERIDRDNILDATMWAMARGGGAALAWCPSSWPSTATARRKLGCASRTIVKGDARCLSIAAASIIAKVTRDRIMIALGAQHPGYGFERHKGYGTRRASRRDPPPRRHRASPPLVPPVQLALGLVARGQHGS